VLAPTLLAIGFTLGSAALDQADRLRETTPRLDTLVAAPEEAVFQAAERAVSNWRWEAATRLEPSPVAALAALADADQPVVTRCVKLNNYWCIKSARWNGELGTDDEGHVGFASAERAADAAATLLRRYYLEFGRKSALDIVRRWAPAECNLIGSAGAPAALAVRGIGGTVRARYLAGQRRVRAAGTRGTALAKRPIPRVSTIAPRALPAFRVPEIAVGMSEKPRTLSSTLPYRVAPPRSARAAPSVASARPMASAAPPSTPAPVVCASDEQRLRNYASRIVEGLDIAPGDDLKLFEADGMPTANLAPVMRAMSAFELGALQAEAALVEEAVERQRERARAEQAPEVQAP
jgi:hypothetical protein